MMNIDEIGGWFLKENRTTLEVLIKQHQIKTVLEIGSFLGLSAAWFATRVARVTCIDTWTETAQEDGNNNLVATLRRFGIPRDFFSVFQNNMREVGVDQKIETVRGNSRYVSNLVGDFDLVYIDGDHSLDGCLSDIRLYGPKARKVLCGDDYIKRDDFGVIGAVQTAIPHPTLQTNAHFWWTEACPIVTPRVPAENQS